MKVLITGGYGFIGSHVADRFNKEGYEVYIIDNLTSGTTQNVNYKHKGYRLSAEDKKCEEIFRSNRFDAVVHLAAQVNVTESINNPRLDTQSNVLGLVNMLSLAQKYAVKKFIFASSAAVYGMNDNLPLPENAVCDPISPYGISKHVGEEYCLKWNELYGLDTIVFRFSNVYGPRQAHTGEGGVVSVFMENALAGRALTVNGDGEQTRDFIYVEDVADAIYRASYSRLQGVYNLSTNTECSVNELAHHVMSLHDTTYIEYGEERAGDIKRSVLDNARVNKDLDWAPLYNFQEGLNKTYTWFSDNYTRTPKVAEAKKTETTKERSVTKKIKPYAENLLAFALIAWLGLSNFDESYNFIDMKIFYITIIGIMYGNRQSITASALSIGLLLYQNLLDGRELISLLYDTDFFFQSAVYLFIGLFVGYAIERKNGVIVSQVHKIEEISDKYEFLNGVYTEVREVKDELQQRIQNSGDSFGKIYSVTKELDSLEPEEIFNSTVSVVESIMGTNAVSIYTVNNYRNYLRLVAHSIGGETGLTKSIKVEDFDYLKKMFAEGSMHINKELKGGVPLMSAPVQNGGETVAVICIDGVQFEKFSLYHQNLFKVTVELVSSALSRAFSYVEATESNRYVEGTSILQKEVFASILESKKLAKEKHRINYILLSCQGKVESNLDKISAISKLLRETDYIGIGQDDDVWILLSNTAPSDAENVFKRFAEKNIALTLLEEEVVYG